MPFSMEMNKSVGHHVGGRECSKKTSCKDFPRFFPHTEISIRPLKLEHFHYSLPQTLYTGTKFSQLKHSLKFLLAKHRAPPGAEAALLGNTSKQHPRGCCFLPLISRP